MSGTVIEVNDADFERLVIQSDKPVVVDFWAPWCGPCRVMDPIFKELAAAHTGVTFAKVNVDDNMAVSARYSILSIPTLLVFEGGEVVATQIGAMPKGKLTAVLEPWLSAAAA